MNLLEILERTVDKLGLAHFARPSGSYIQEKDGTRIAGKSFVELLEWALETGRFEEVTNEVPTFKKPKDNFGNCQYFRFEMPPEVEAFQGADMLVDLDVDQASTQIVRMDTQTWYYVLSWSGCIWWIALFYDDRRFPL